MTIRPNVLFLCADQWRGDCLSAVGHPNVRTPNIDALAAEGVLFRDHFTQCTPCGPSRTSLLTGLYLMNHRSGRNGTPLDARHTNVALEARKAGYRPTLFGYTDTSADPRDLHGNDPTLKTYESVMPGFEAALHLPDEMEEWIADLLARGYDLPGGRHDVFRPKPGFDRPADRGFRYIPTVYPAGHSEAAFLTDALLKWLSARRGSPWFAHFVFLRPHPPLIAPEPYNGLVHPAEVAFPQRAASLEEEKRQHPMLAYELDRLSEPGRYDEHSPFDPVSAEDLEIRQMRATYYGLIAEVDHHVGRIVDYLKATGEYDRTLIVLTSDHAEMLGQHHAWGKEIYFDQAFHVPLIIRDPRRAADGTRGRQVEAFSEAVDVMPTILDWLGLPVPRPCDGCSLLPLVRGEEPQDWRSEVHFEHDFRTVVTQRAEQTLGITSDQCSYAVIRDRHYKYVHFAALPPLLFDIETDPDETTNLADRPDMAATVLRYAQKMLDWRLRHADRTLTNMAITKEGLFSRP